MRFKITYHSGHKPPEDGMEKLAQRLGRKREEVSFSKVGNEVWAVLESEPPVSMTQDERTGIGRRAVLDVMRDVCDATPELESDWFAVSPGR